MEFTVYKTTTGAISFSGTADDTTGFAGMGEAVSTAGAYDFETYYLPSGTPTLRPALTTVATVTNSGGVWTANGSDTLVFGSLPDPTDVNLFINDPAAEGTPTTTVTDGTLTVTTVSTFEHQFVLKSFPYLDYTYTITPV